MRWTRIAASNELRTLAEQVDGLTGQTAGSADHVRWVARVRSILADVFGGKSDFYQSFTALPWQRTGAFLVGGPSDPSGSMNPGPAIAREHHRAYLEQLDGARGLLLGAADQLDRSGLPHHPGFGDRLRVAVQDGVAEGLRLGLRNGIVALVSFVFGLLIGALTPVSDWLARMAGRQ